MPGRQPAATLPVSLNPADGRKQRHPLGFRCRLVIGLLDGLHRVDDQADVREVVHGAEEKESQPREEPDHSYGLNEAGWGRTGRTELVHREGEQDRADANEGEKTGHEDGFNDRPRGKSTGDRFLRGSGKQLVGDACDGNSEQAQTQASDEDRKRPRGLCRVGRSGLRP